MARFLIEHGKRVVPVHPHAETVHGEPGFTTLHDIPFDVDCVDIADPTALPENLVPPEPGQGLQVAEVLLQLGEAQALRGAAQDVGAPAVHLGVEQLEDPSQ